LVGVLLASLSAHRRRLGDPPSGEPIPRALGLPVIPLAVAATPAGGAGLGALALMAVVTGRLERAALVDVWTVLLTVVSAALLLRYRVNSTWLVLGGAVAGLVLAG